MAGHSQFKNIMHRKGAQDAKRAKLFTKILREVMVAAKIGPDPDHNPRLRSAMAAAREANLPKDRISAAITKATSACGGENFEEMRYEGYGPGSIALIVEALTDNRNRTASEVRSAFSKFGGQLGETGSVSYMFKRVGLITYPLHTGSPDKFLEATIEANGNDCVSEEMHEIICEPELLQEVRENLEQQFGEPTSATITWKPNSVQVVSDNDGERLLKLLDALDDCDDVQNVVGNFALPDTLLSKLKSE